MNKSSLICLTLFLVVDLITNSLSASDFNKVSHNGSIFQKAEGVWVSNESNILIGHKLSTAGINSTLDWVGCGYPNSAGNPDNIIEKAFDDGWSHFTFIICIDNFFDNEQNLKIKSSLAKIRAITAQINRIIERNPQALFVIALKSRELIGGVAKGGIRTSKLYSKFEKSDEHRSAFIDLWGLIANQTKEIPDINLVFNLMNEPEYHNVAFNRKQNWKSFASEIIKEIRETSPERTVILEGVLKSLLGRKHTPFEIMPLVNFKNVIYGFHYYEPYEFTHWQKVGGTKFTKKMEAIVREDLKQLRHFSEANKVPVILSEIGVWGPYPTIGEPFSGVSFEERAKYMSVIREETLDYGIGLTWWGLGEINTPYHRQGTSKTIIGIEMNKDALLWKALDLESNKHNDKVMLQNME